MGTILEYIEKSGEGKYPCYKTKKFSLDSNENDTIAYNYDDKVIEYNPRFSNLGLDAIQWNHLYPVFLSIILKTNRVHGKIVILQIKSYASKIK